MINIFFDIETIPDPGTEPELPSYDDFKQDPKPVPSNLKDPEKICERKSANKDKAKKEQEILYAQACKKAEESWRKKSLTRDCNIISIAWAFDDEPAAVMSATDEKTLLQGWGRQIWEGIKKPGTQYRYIGHNIGEFDLPILWHRYIKNRIPKPHIPTPKKPWNTDHCLDTLYTIPKTNADSMKLGDLFKSYDLNGKDDFDGSMILDAYNSGEINKIKEYNKSEVEKLRELVKILGLIE